MATAAHLPRLPDTHMHVVSMPPHGTIIFSKIHLVQTHYRTSVVAEDPEETTDLFEFLFMPVELHSVAQTFHRFIESVTRELDFFHVYVDDLSVESSTANGDIQYLPLLSQILSDCCAFSRTKRIFLNHVIIPGDTKSCLDKLLTARARAMYSSTKELRTPRGLKSDSINRPSLC